MASAAQPCKAAVCRDCWTAGAHSGLPPAWAWSCLCWRLQNCASSGCMVDLWRAPAQGRTTVRTTDATGVEETRETLHGLTKSEAQVFDDEWAKRGGPGNPGDLRRCAVRVGWLIIHCGECAALSRVTLHKRLAAAGSCRVTKRILPSQCHWRKLHVAPGC